MTRTTPADPPARHWRAVCSRQAWWAISAGVAAALAIGAPHEAAQLCGLEAVLVLTAMALDVRLRLALPACAALPLMVLPVWALEGPGHPSPEAPLTALMVGLFLAGAVPLPPWRDGAPGADRAIEVGTLLLALAFPVPLALAAGPLTALHGAAVALGICLTVSLVAATIVSLDTQMTSARVRHSVVR